MVLAKLGMALARKKRFECLLLAALGSFTKGAETGPTLSGFTCCPLHLDVQHTVWDDGLGGVSWRWGKVTCTASSPDHVDDVSYSYSYGSGSGSGTMGGKSFDINIKGGSDFGNERVYKINTISLTGNGGAVRTYSEADITEVGGTTQFRVTNTGANFEWGSCPTAPPSGSTKAPAMTNWTCCPLSVDVQGGRAQATCTPVGASDLDSVSLERSTTKDGNSYGTASGVQGGTSYELSFTGGSDFGNERVTTFEEVTLHAKNGYKRTYSKAEISAMSGTTHIRATNRGAATVACPTASISLSISISSSQKQSASLAATPYGCIASFVFAMLVSWSQLGPDFQ